LTFSDARGEHTTAFAGHGKATRKIIRDLCADYKYLKPDCYIDQTLAAFDKWAEVFRGIGIPLDAGAGYHRILQKDHESFEGAKPSGR
jgi:serine/threonine-protein kinase HipA